MALTRLFVRDNILSGAELALDGEQARYVGRVLRLRAGDHLTVFNGNDGEFAARVLHISKNAAAVLVDAHIDLKMMIYTRWGEMIWETNEVYRGWDGYLKSGELAQPGVYVYKAYVTYVDGMQELLTGDVTFLH